MSKQRETFEAWWRREMNVEVWGLVRTVYPDGVFVEQEYVCNETERGWMAWQASRAAALEEALLAVEAEELSGESNDPADIAYDCAVEDCIAAVKALKEQS